MATGRAGRDVGVSVRRAGHSGERPAARRVPLAVWYEGTIRYHAGGSWHLLGTGPALDPSTTCDTLSTCRWSTIRVNAGTTTATITVDGAIVGTATRFDGGTSNLTGHQFSASSTADGNESFLVDDVRTADS